MRSISCACQFIFSIYQKFFSSKNVRNVPLIVALTRGAAHRKIPPPEEHDAHITTRSNALAGNRALRRRVLRRLWPQGRRPAFRGWRKFSRSSRSKAHGSRARTANGTKTRFFDQG